TRRARPAGPAPGMDRRGVQVLLHRPDHQPHHMIRRQPLPHVRRQQERLITIDPEIALRHNQSLSNTLPADSRTSHPRSADSATAPPRPERYTLTPEGRPASTEVMGGTRVANANG